jgi:predicted nucleic acid-binding protein
LIVIDASVAVKWALTEAGSERALTLLQSGQPMTAPDLLRLEGTGAITRAFRAGRLPAGDVQARLDLWLDAFLSIVALVPGEPYLRRAASLSCDLRHPLFDCLYLALAEHLDLPLFTADEVFAARVAEQHPRVQVFPTTDA